MDITITIPTDKKDAVIDAFALQYKYQEEVDDGKGEGGLMPNPVTKGQFALNIMRSFVKEVYVAAQVKPIQEQTKTIAQQASEEMDVITIT